MIKSLIEKLNKVLETSDIEIGDKVKVVGKDIGGGLTGTVVSVEGENVDVNIKGEKLHYKVSDLEVVKKVEESIEYLVEIKYVDDQKASDNVFYSFIMDSISEIAQEYNAREAESSKGEITFELPNKDSADGFVQEIKDLGPKVKKVTLSTSMSDPAGGKGLHSHESLEDYNLRLNDDVKIVSVADYGQIGTIVDWDDVKKNVTVEFGSHGERKEFSIEDVKAIEENIKMTTKVKSLLEKLNKAVGSESLADSEIARYNELQSKYDKDPKSLNDDELKEMGTLTARNALDKKPNESKITERNMSYCRFENTYNDLKDCADNFDEPLEKNGTEAKYRLRMLELCQSIVDSNSADDLQYGEEGLEDEEEDTDESKKNEASYRFYDIEWDEGDKKLPSTVKRNIDISSEDLKKLGYKNAEEWVENEASNFLSDEFGYTINSLKYEKASDSNEAAKEKPKQKEKDKGDMSFDKAVKLTGYDKLTYDQKIIGKSVRLKGMTAFGNTGTVVSYNGSNDRVLVRVGTDKMVTVNSEDIEILESKKK